MKHAAEYRDGDLAGKIARGIHDLAGGRSMRIMEVCGTHTVSIFKSGIRSLLPPGIALLSGPGCPVCVTSQTEIDRLCRMAEMDGMITATFGDMIRVPGSNASLAYLKAEGKDIRIVYSATDAVEIAVRNPDKKVLLAGIGFETTTPTIAASILMAHRMNVTNYFVLCCHKRVGPALDALMQIKDTRIDGFLLPGHVAVITGTREFIPFSEAHGIPCAIAGFEPADILRGILSLAEQIVSARARVENCYPRGVTYDGNPRAIQVMGEVFDVTDALWRGIGWIAGSGLKIRKTYEMFDAEKHFNVTLPSSSPPSGCKCGMILTGRLVPPQCPLFGKTCTPDAPTGPCMVSGEGTCAAYYRYHPPVTRE